MNRRPANLNRTRRDAARCARPSVAPHAPIPLRKRCGSGKLASNTAMPFEYFTAVSRDPWLLRLCHRLGVVALLLVSACQWSAAQETKPAPVEKPAAQPTPAQPTNAVAAEKPVAPPAPAKESTSKTTPAPAKASASTLTTSKSAPAPAALSYDSFKLIADRNIFDSSRSKGITRAPRTNAAPPAARVESFALVGTMSYAKGDFAFFDGTSPQYRKALKAGDVIGAYKVKEVTPNQVKLVGEKQEWELKVGQQLRREEEGEWQVSARPESFASSGGDSGSSASGPSTPSGSSDSGGASEILRRLREKREQESNK